MQGAVVVASLLLVLGAAFRSRAVCQKFLRGRRASMHVSFVVACFYVVPVVYNLVPSTQASPYRGTGLERL